MLRRVCFFVLAFMVSFPLYTNAEGNGEIDCKSYVLMEQSTGRILSESNPDEQLPIASVTKIMTMLIIMEAIDDGVISFDTKVSVSENAMSYGGSTMFLEAGEELTVSDMLKGIAVASANDGCVAMAEHLSGSEEAFVDKMNTRAKELGMKNTSFKNTNGLDEEGHFSSARDVAIMSKELLNHKEIFNYTTIWMDELRDGQFQLANTNKLIRFYKGANGLKTGSTSEALCCLSASAKRDNMQLIAVVLGAPTSDKRFQSAKKLLDYGFANYSVNTMVLKGDKIADAEVVNGIIESVGALAKEDKTRLCEKNNNDEVIRRVHIKDNLRAPIYEGDIIGTVEFCIKDKVIDSSDLVAEKTVDKKGYGQIIRDLIGGFI